jgi:subtilisin
MPQGNSAVDRRDVLKLAGGAIAATGLASAKPGDTVEVNVGYSAESGRQAALSKADSVEREFNFDALTLRTSAQAADALAARADVRYVEANRQYRALAQTLPWGIDRVDADVLHDNNETGNGADIAIIDTGIDDDHPDLQANVGKGTAYVSCSGTNCNYEWSDDNDHGTHCAGIADAVDNTEGVVGVSTEATLHAVKVLDDGGSGYWSDIASGIEWVADQGYDVGSMSLGGSSGSSTVQDACQYAQDKGVFLVAAAGNSGPCSDCVGYPAAYSSVMAVSSTDSSDNLSSFSSTGPEVEIAAPGSDVYSTVIGGYDTFSGTSMACPHVAGAAGQLMSNGKSNSQARQTLKDTAEDLGLGSNEQGAGLLDAAAALGYSDGGGGGGGDNPPAIDTFSTTNNSNGGWARFNVDWAVSDTDGDLSSVEVTMTQNSTTVDSTTNSVSGSSASGSDRLQDKKGSGSYDITLTVTDGNGNTASQTKTVTA